MTCIGIAWFEEQFFAKDGVHFGSLWNGICKKTQKVMWIVSNPEHILLYPNIEIDSTWDVCNFGKSCLNVNCYYSEVDSFEEAFQKTILRYDKSVEGKKKTYIKKWSDRIKQCEWLLLKEVQQGNVKFSNTLSDTEITEEFMICKTNYMPEFMPKSKKKKNKRKRISGNVRQNVFMRDKYRCRICGATVEDGAKLEIDHILPVSKGGSNDENNLQTLCQRCNREKRNRTDLLHDKKMLRELNG